MYGFSCKILEIRVSHKSGNNRVYYGCYRWFTGDHERNCYFISDWKTAARYHRQALELSNWYCQIKNIQNQKTHKQISGRFRVSTANAKMTGRDTTSLRATKKSANYLQNLFLQLLYRKVMGYLWKNYSFLGSCARITETKITVQPAISRGVSHSRRNIQPPSTAKTDSRLISKVTVTGCRYFCATICKVNAAAPENAPQKIQNGRDW